MADQDPPSGAKPPAGPRVHLHVDDDVAQGSYSNLVLINHTENEFVLDFAFVPPGAPRAKVRARVVSSPQHTKRLLRALTKNVEKYEQRFGVIGGEPGGPDDDEILVH